MARNLDDIHKRIEDIARKERGVFLTPAQIDRWLDDAQLDVFEYFYAIYGTTESSHDAMDIFKVIFQFTSAADGSVIFPSDYLHLLPDVFTVTGSTVNKVRFVNEAEWVDAMKSQLRPVSTSKPVARDSAGGFRLLPETQQIGKFTYFKRPRTPVYAYTLSGGANRTITYDAANSIQLEWLGSFVNKIIAKALTYAGIYMDEEAIVQFGAAKDDQITKEISG